MSKALSAQLNDILALTAPQATTLVLDLNPAWGGAVAYPCRTA